MSYNKDFNALVAEFTPMIRHIIRNKYISNYSKEDLVQECLLVLHSCNESYDEKHKTRFSSYFYSSARNRIYDLIREANRDKRPQDVVGQDSVDTFYEYNDDEEQEELLDAILKALKSMPRGDITFKLYLEDKTLDQVAEEEGLSKQRIHFLNKRNIKRLRKIFADDIFDFYF